MEDAVARIPLNTIETSIFSHNTISTFPSESAINFSDCRSTENGNNNVCFSEKHTTHNGNILDLVKQYQRGYV